MKINDIVTNLPSKKLRYNDKISVNIINKKESKLKPEKISLDIIFEDKDLIVINKKKGMVVHPGAGNYENTLANGLMYKYKKKLV